MRKLLLAAGLVGLIAAAVPQTAQANTAAGVVELIGDATVGEAWSGGPGGEGLCLPTRINTAGCPEGGDLEQDAQEWQFTVPGAGGQIPPSCRAGGLFPGNVVATPGVGSNCVIDANGLVGTNGHVGPSCGMSYGDSSAGPVGHTDTITIAGTEYDIYIQWTTSAGGTLPLEGTITDGSGHSHAVRGVVQARPLTPGACASAPASTFTVIGAVASAGN
ncbi:MAG: hypothetical protein HYU28_07070 [Actinobacteria bacterium]|nr:hypothetical protein [Actinomycetota bacterium]